MMEPVVNWVGNKSKEAALLLSCFPIDYKNYYEPFVGSGSVFLNNEAGKIFINDRCRELAELYRIIKDGRGAFFSYLDCFSSAWLNIDREYFLQSDYLVSAYKAFRIEQTNYYDMQSEVNALLARIEMDNVFSCRLTGPYSFEIEKRFRVYKRFVNMLKDEQNGGEYDDGKILRKIRTALKTAVYGYLQNIYNRHTTLDDLRVALFYFLMSYNSSGAYLMDKRHEFSVPYGGEKFNDRRIESKVYALHDSKLRAKLSDVYVGGSDYRTFFLRTRPGREDFIFLDPPELGNYVQNGGWPFSFDDFIKLLHFLQYECSSRWLLVVRNQEKMRELMSQYPYRIVAYSKYQLEIMDVDEESATHMIICNF